VLGALSTEGTWTVLETHREAAVDPVGAGDAFNAGYLGVRLRGGPVLEALATGARCGRAVAMQLGDTAGFPEGADGADPRTAPIQNKAARAAIE
jgi:2-dehydro-3-deoxygluconokinase